MENNNLNDIKQTLTIFKKQMDLMKQQLKKKTNNQQKLFMISQTNRTKNQEIDIKIQNLKIYYEKKIKQVQDGNLKSINQLKTNLNQKIQKVQNTSNDKIQSIKREIVQINNKIRSLEVNNQSQSAKQTEVANRQTELENKLKFCMNQIQYLWRSINLKTSYRVQKVGLTVDTSTDQFQDGFYQLIDNKIKRCIFDAQIRQVVGKQQLPSKGKFLFQVYYHQKNYCYIRTIVGILTENCKFNKNSFLNKQAISYDCGKGYIYEDGSSRQLGKPVINRKRLLITVLIDIDNGWVSFYIDNQYQAQTKINQNLQNQRLYAFIEVDQSGQHEFIR